MPPPHEPPTSPPQGGPNMGPTRPQRAIIASLRQVSRYRSSAFGRVFRLSPANFLYVKGTLPYPKPTHIENPRRKLKKLKNSKTSYPRRLDERCLVGKKRRKKICGFGQPESQLRRRRVRFGNWRIPLITNHDEIPSRLRTCITSNRITSAQARIEPVLTSSPRLTRQLARCPGTPRRP